MRLRVIVSFLALTCGLAICSAEEPSTNRPETAADGPSVKEILRHASELALKQDAEQEFWFGRILQQVSQVQMRAADFEGARRTIRGMTDSDRKEGLAKLAEAMAGAGIRPQHFLNDDVRLRWIEHLISAGDLEGSKETVEQLAPGSNRPDALRKLAVACAKARDVDKSKHYFSRAVDAAMELTGFERARALWETGDAQLSVARVDDAKATIGRLVEAAEVKDSWTRVAALREAGVLYAKSKDRPAAQRLFRRAIEALDHFDESKELDARNKIGSLSLIAQAQAGVGYIDDAKPTASMIEDRESDYGEREQALLAVVVAQLNAGDVEGAMRTALSIEHYLSYRDDALHAIIEYELRNRAFMNTRARADKINESSRKASAMLKIATAYARLGDRKTAAQIAARIELMENDPIIRRDAITFDFQRPQTWGVCYEPSFSLASIIWSNKRAAEVAGCAMTLAQSLSLDPVPDHAETFNGIHAEQAIQALARSHAAAGNPREALAWAQRIGGDKKVAPEGDDRTLWEVTRRIFALVGVAEGILDRANEGRPEPKP